MMYTYFEDDIEIPVYSFDELSDIYGVPFIIPQLLSVETTDDWDRFLDAYIKYLDSVSAHNITVHRIAFDEFAVMSKNIKQC